MLTYEHSWVLQQNISIAYINHKNNISSYQDAYIVDRKHDSDTHDRWQYRRWYNTSNGNQWSYIQHLCCNCVCEPVNTHSTNYSVVKHIHKPLAGNKVQLATAVSLRQLLTSRHNDTRSDREDNAVRVLLLQSTGRGAVLTLAVVISTEAGYSKGLITSQRWTAQVAQSLEFDHEKR